MLTGLQLDNFLTNGYLVIEDFVSQHTCQQLSARMDALINEHEHQRPNIAFSSECQSHANHPYFTESADKIHFFLEPNALTKSGKLKRQLKNSLNKVGHGLHVADNTFKDFSFDPRIQAICQQLDFARVGLLQSMYIFKQAGIGDAVNWHQDDTFLHVDNSHTIGFWFALEDATLDNGCLQAIPSPNNTKLKQRMRVIDGQSTLQHLEHTPFDEARAIPLPVKQGTLVMLHGRLPHASSANLSKKTRHAYALHAIDTSKHYSEDNWLQWPHKQIPEFHS